MDDAEQNYEQHGMNQQEHENNGHRANTHNKRIIDDWMLIYQHEPELTANNSQPDQTPSQPTTNYNIDEMISFVERSKLSAPTVPAPAPTEIDFNTMNESQLKAFNIIKEYSEQLQTSSQPPEPLRMIVSGTAGTGKSYLIKCIKQLLKDKCRLLAPTGVAAHNINGETIHRCFRLGVNTSDNTPELKGDLLMEAQKENANIQLYIIDEMPMVGKRMLGMIDTRMRQIFPATGSEVLGGKAVVLVGDFGQHNPVCDAPLYSTFGNSKLSDIGGAVYTQFKTTVVLKAILRQSEDMDFQSHLQHVRNGQVTAADYQKFASRFDGVITGPNRARFDSAIRIMPRKAQVAEYNLSKLKSLSKLHKTVKIEATHTGGKKALSASSDEACGLPRMLFVCKTARVMLTTNIWVEKGLCNGSMGTIVDIVYAENSAPGLPAFIVVQFDKYSGPSCRHDLPNCVPITPIRRFWSSANTTCSREMIPLALSWAITVHKSQRLTLPCAVVDIGDYEFCPQLTFVAFSRVPSLQDIILVFFTYERMTCLCKGKRFMERFAEDVRLREMDLGKSTATTTTTTTTTTRVHDDIVSATESGSHRTDTSIIPNPNDIPIVSNSNCIPVIPVQFPQPLASQPPQPNIPASPPAEANAATSVPTQPGVGASQPVQHIAAASPSILPAVGVLTNTDFMPLINTSNCCYSNVVVQCMVSLSCLQHTLMEMEFVPFELAQLIERSSANLLSSTHNLRQAIDQAIGTETYVVTNPRDADRDAIDFATDLINCLPPSYHKYFTLSKTVRITCTVCGERKFTEPSTSLGVDHVFIPERAEGQLIALTTLLQNSSCDTNPCQKCQRTTMHESCNVFETTEETDVLLVALPLFFGNKRLNYELFASECEEISFAGSCWRLHGAVFYRGDRIRDAHYTCSVKKDGYWLTISDQALLHKSGKLHCLRDCQLLVYTRF